jgi:hypothetical protein
VRAIATFFLWLSLLEGCVAYGHFVTNPSGDAVTGAGWISMLVWFNPVCCYFFGRMRRRVALLSDIELSIYLVDNLLTVGFPSLAPMVYLFMDMAKCMNEVETGQDYVRAREPSTREKEQAGAPTTRAGSDSDMRGKNLGLRAKKAGGSGAPTTRAGRLRAEPRAASEGAVAIALVVFTFATLAAVAIAPSCLPFPSRSLRSRARAQYDECSAVLVPQFSISFFFFFLMICNVIIAPLTSNELTASKILSLRLGWRMGIEALLVVTAAYCNVYLFACVPTPLTRGERKRSCLRLWCSRAQKKLASPLVLASLTQPVANSLSQILRNMEDGRRSHQMMVFAMTAGLCLCGATFMEMAGIVGWWGKGRSGSAVKLNNNKGSSGSLKRGSTNGILEHPLEAF